MFDGLELLKSPYDLVETFPLIGIGIKLKRYDGSKQNPWLVKVHCMPIIDKDILTKRVFDTCYISENPDFLQTYEGMEINAVLPLIDLNIELDKKLHDIYSTDLFNLLMSWNVTLNLDDFNKDAYFALLAASYVYLLKLDINKIEKKYDVNVLKDLKNRIIDTTRILKRSKKHSVKTFIYTTYKKSNTLFIDDHKNKYKDFSQIILVMYYLKKYKKIDEDELEELLQRFWIEYFFIRLSKCDIGISKLISFSFKDIITKGFMTEIEGSKILEKYWTSREIIMDVKKRFDKNIKIDITDETTVTLNEVGLKDDHDTEIPFILMKKIHLELTGQEVTNDELISFITIAFLHKDDSKSRATASICLDTNFNSKTLFNNYYSDLADTNKKNLVVQRIQSQILSQCRSMYFNEFKKCHFETKPLTWEEIRKLCEVKNIDYNKLKYNADSMLLQNACQSPSCPHFLKPSAKRLRDHLGGWQEKMPRGFHFYISNHISLKDEEIYSHYLKERNITSIENYDVDKQYVIDYIRLVKNGYNNTV